MEYQLELSFQRPEQPTLRGQPDDEAIRMIREFEPLALRNDPRGYCVRHFYIHNITGIDPPELVYFQRRNFQEYRDMGLTTYDIMYDKSMWQLMIEKKFPPLIRLREQEGRVNEYASGQEWFEWWLGDRAQEIPIDTDQMMLEDY